MPNRPSLYRLYDRYDIFISSPLAVPNIIPSFLWVTSVASRQSQLLLLSLLIYGTSLYIRSYRFLMIERVPSVRSRRLFFQHQPCTVVCEPHGGTENLIQTPGIPVRPFAYIFFAPLFCFPIVKIFYISPLYCTVPHDNPTLQHSVTAHFERTTVPVHQGI